MAKHSHGWQQFVLAHGWEASGHEMAAVVGQPVEEVERVRRTAACKRLAKPKGFAELFSLWHGRPPADEDWPVPRKYRRRGSYEWQTPELALLATLVGQLGKVEIAKILTKRLRKLTDDRRANRSLNAVQMAINHKLGMVTTDVVGGITIAAAGREVGSRAVVYQCIRKKQLRSFRVGRLWVIPRKAWGTWKASRVFPPKGYVQLSSIRRPLGIRSDKLSEWARMGYVPTAVRCNPFGLGIKQTKFGIWFISPKIARKLVADRRAGRPMPWWGKVEPGNLKVTWKRLQARMHPATCSTCAQIWGPKGPPRAYEDYLRRYPPLDLGAKRHLTRKWGPGMTMAEVARHCGCSPVLVRRAIENGTLNAEHHGQRLFVSRADATYWKARRRPTGESERSWISLQTASKQYLFTRRHLRGLIAKKKLRAKVGASVPMRGAIYVPRHQLAELRRKTGFTEKEAARRVSVTVEKLRRLLKGAEWRSAEGIPLATVRAVQQRLESREGYTFEQAAAALRVPVAWVHERQMDGTIRVSRARWDRRRIYISKPMFKRLQEAKRNPIPRERFNADWLLLSKAANEAGVTAATIIKWAGDGELARRRSHIGWRYHRRAVRARARRYWKTNRFHRAVPPYWLRPAA